MEIMDTTNCVNVNIPDLVTEFHTLEGDYLAQKQRSFGRFFAKVKCLLKTYDDQLSFINSIVPQSRTEDILRVQIFLHYKYVEELWNILFNEDLQLMSKILKCKWFFKEGFVDITPEVLVLAVFPKVSYLVRLRMLNKLNRYLGDEMKSNLYFEAVKSHYGLVQASILLPSCSEEFILNKTKLHGIKLKELDLVRVYKRYPTFPERYFTLLKQNEQAITNYCTLMKYLVLHDTEKYWQFKHDFQLHLILNRKQTTQLMRLYKPLIMQNLRSLISELNRKALMAQVLIYEYPVFLKEIFPLNSEHFTASLIYDFDSYIFQYLQKIDKSLWLPLIEQAYYNAYNENFRDVPSLITPTILQLMPVDERTKFAEMKIATDNNEQWICHYATEKAIGIIKSKINLTAQIPQRSQYIKMLVTTCKINNDKAALLEVLKYFVNRHKNDDVQLKLNFLSSIQELFEIDKLSVDHVNLILDILKLFNLKHGSWLCGASSILAKVVLHHIDNNLPIRHVLITYFKIERRRDVIDLFRKSPKQTKYVLLAIADMIQDLSIAVNEEHDDKWSFYACYVNSLINWNKQHKKDQIPLSQFPFVETFFKEIAGNNIYDYSLIKYIKAANYSQELQNLLCDAFWKSIGNSNGMRFYVPDTDSWFAKYKPHYIFDSVEMIFSNKYWNWRNFQTLMRCSNVSEKLTEKASEIVSNLRNLNKIPDEDAGKYNKAILILAYNPQYVDLVKPYLPPENGIVNSGDDSALYSLRLTIVQALESIRKPSTTLETLLLFLKGDFLHSSLSTLYKITQNTPMCQLVDFLRTLSNKAISVRKHAIYLNATLMNTDTIYDMLAKTGEKEDNPSLRKVILKRTLKYFLEDGKDNESFWHLLKLQIFRLHSEDLEGHRHLLVLNKIPLKHQPEYIEALWQLFSISQNKTVNNLRFDLLGSIHKKLFVNLSNAFCDEVIKISLAKPFESMISNKIYEFVFNSLLYGDHTRTSPRLECVFELLRGLLNDSGKTNGVTCEIAQDFIIKCCTYLIYKRKDEPYAALVNILEILRLKWSANFTCLVAFHQFLILNFTALYFECSRNKFESVIFVQKLGTMFDDMVATFGESLIQLFSNIARQFLRIICVAEELNNDECVLHTLRALSINHKQQSRLILVINTLPVKMAKTTVLKSLHLSILDSLRMSTNDAVQLHLNNYLTNTNMRNT